MNTGIQNELASAAIAIESALIGAGILWAKARGDAARMDLSNGSRVIATGVSDTVTEEQVEELLGEWADFIADVRIDDSDGRAYLVVALVSGHSTDEQNDAIWAQVEAEWPRPLGGFEREDDEDKHRAFQERRFMELVQNALAAPSNKGDMNKLTKWEQLVELFQNQPEIHLDVEVDPGTHSQAYRLHNGKDGEEWQEFYSGTLDTTLEDHKGDVIYVNEVAAGLLSISGGFRKDLAGITDYKNLAAGIKA